jgi:flagellar biosynthesis protein FlhG
MTHLTDAGLRTFARCLGELAACEDVLVLDMGAGISNQNVVTLSCADHVVLVIQPELASLTDAYAIVKCVAQLSDRPKLSVVVNRTTTSTQGPATFDKLAQVARKFTGLNLHYVGAIPEDPAVTLRRLGQQPIVATDPGGAIASAVRATVRRLSEVSGPFERREVPAAEGIEARFLAHRQIF